MDLKAYDKTYGNFYVPSFVVRVGSDDLVRNLFLTVTGVDVDLKAKAMSHFSFSIADAFDWETREFVAKKDDERVDLMQLFAFGSSIEISMGYGDASALEPILKGMVTEIGTEFRAGGGPELKISGFDGLYPLSTGKNTEPWENKSDDQVVADLIRDLGFSPNIKKTAPVIPRIDQNEQSDLAFIDKLAKRNGMTFYARGREFYFGPRRNKESEAVELVWGEGLLSFAPQVNLAKQITAVEVYGWSAEKGDIIVGKAQRGDETGRDPNRQSGGDLVAKAIGKPAVMKIRAALHSQQEADARAKAILDERALEYVTADGECVGLPDIVPDVNISLTGLASRFSKTYYVAEATHKIDSSGYRTTFKVQETTV
jgi:uncharacterized protein